MTQRTFEQLFVASTVVMLTCMLLVMIEANPVHGCALWVSGVLWIAILIYGCQIPVRTRHKDTDSIAAIRRKRRRVKAFYVSVFACLLFAVIIVTVLVQRSNLSQAIDQDNTYTSVGMPD